MPQNGVGVVRSGMTCDRTGRSLCAVAALVLLAACGLAGDHPYMVEGQPHAEAIVAAFAREWNADELIKHTSPQMLSAFPESNIRKLANMCSGGLGRPKSQKTLTGSAGVDVGVSPGKYALYLIELQCEKAAARVQIKLRKTQGDWAVIGFWVDSEPTVGASPATAPSKP